MKTRSAKLGVILIALVGLSVTGHAQPSRERVIVRMPVEKNEPLTIVETRVSGQKIVLGQKFSANDDWLRGLVFSVKNTSDKLILFASVELFIQQPDGARGMFDIFYGPWALQNRKPKPEEQLVGIPPGEITEIGFSVQRYVGFITFLNDTHIGPSVENVKVRFGSVIFEDDTMWTRGSEYSRDLTNPGRWNNANP